MNLYRLIQAELAKFPPESPLQPITELRHLSAAESENPEKVLACFCTVEELPVELFKIFTLCTLSLLPNELDLEDFSNELNSLPEETDKGSVHLHAAMYELHRQGYFSAAIKRLTYRLPVDTDKAIAQHLAAMGVMGALTLLAESKMLQGNLSWFMDESDEAVDTVFTLDFLKSITLVCLQQKGLLSQANLNILKEHPDLKNLAMILMQYFTEECHDKKDSADSVEQQTPWVLEQATFEILAADNDLKSLENLLQAAEASDLLTTHDQGAALQALRAREVTYKVLFVMRVNHQLTPTNLDYLRRYPNLGANLSSLHQGKLFSYGPMLTGDSLISQANIDALIDPCNSCLLEARLNMKGETEKDGEFYFFEWLVKTLGRKLTQGNFDNIIRAARVKNDLSDAIDCAFSLNFGKNLSNRKLHNQMKSAGLFATDGARRKSYREAHVLGKEEYRSSLIGLRRA